MKLRQLLITKYLSYQEQGLAVFTVTLSTFIQEQRNLPEEMFRHMWDDHFIYKIRKRLPIKARLDHDYVIELSPPKLSRGGAIPASTATTDSSRSMLDTSYGFGTAAV